MASFKQQLLYLTVVALAVTLSGVAAANFRAGTWQAKGLACLDAVNLPAQPGKVVSTARTCYVPRYNQNITYIAAVNRGVGGRGGYVRIAEGGIGKRNVTLYMWSQPSQPLNFTIYVHAKPE